MTSYLKKYATAIISAKHYVAQWSTDHLYADQVLIVPFPTLAMYDSEKKIWSIHIKAWLYVPFQGKNLKSYLPSLPSFLRGKTDETKKEEAIDEDNKKVDTEKKQAAAIAIKENNKVKEEEPSDEEDENYEDALEDEFNESNENPGRLGLFFVGNSVKVATKSIINGVEHLCQPSDESGFIEQQLDLSEDEIRDLGTKIHPESDDKKFEYEIELNESKTDENSPNCKPFKCTIYVLASHGVSIISDIDDTIKVSNVLKTRSLLKHTFYSYFKPVDGMSELYQKWSEQKCQFHYVSASPWQLYPALRCFLEKYKYPMGTMNLRKFAWSLKFLKAPDEYKIETITPIIRAYPERKYILVGDSGELDPEIYSKLYSTFPQNIAHIFIRDICRTPECLLTCHERYIKTFENVPHERYTIFKDPKEIETSIEKLIST
ncbi:unnamed protein product [Adineta steineri]|uniref:Phosphatidate phosphatase APP1 catalytic domain-containing protein n=1 Tax=Adineta steineri TaxID=433720 RepID=A0A819STL3_9BILA|nr:unnamed protein product [Adineta steineri]CAF4064691.1 unnamed protein product [Adineta steineri]